MATCNQITALQPELMRKGRFDEIFFIDLPDAAERLRKHHPPGVEVLPLFNPDRPDRVEPRAPR